MSGELRAVIEALRDDLRDNSGLADLEGGLVTVVAGREMRAVTPDDCPCLNVFWVQDREGTLMSGQMNVPVVVEARYFRASTEEAETLIVDEEEAFVMVDAADLITNRLLNRLMNGSFGGGWQIRPLPGAREYHRFGLVEGVGVQGIVDVIYSA